LRRNDERHVKIIKTNEQFDQAGFNAASPDRNSRIHSGVNKASEVFDRYNIVDERDLRDATSKLENHLSKSLGTVWAQFGHFDKDSEQQGKEKSSDGKAATH